MNPHRVTGITGQRVGRGPSEPVDVLGADHSPGTSARGIRSSCRCGLAGQSRDGLDDGVSVGVVWANWRNEPAVSGQVLILVTSVRPRLANRSGTPLAAGRAARRPARALRAWAVPQGRSKRTGRTRRASRPPPGSAVRPGTRLRSPDPAGGPA